MRNTIGGRQVSPSVFIIFCDVQLLTPLILQASLYSRTSNICRSFGESWTQCQQLGLHHDQQRGPTCMSCRAAGAAVSPAAPSAMWGGCWAALAAAKAFAAELPGCSGRAVPGASNRGGGTRGRTWAMGVSGVANTSPLHPRDDALCAQVMPASTAKLYKASASLIHIYRDRRYSACPEVLLAGFSQQWYNLHIPVSRLRQPSSQLTISCSKGNVKYCQPHFCSCTELSVAPPECLCTCLNQPLCWREDRQALPACAGRGREATCQPTEGLEARLLQESEGWWTPSLLRWQGGALAQVCPEWPRGAAARAAQG